MTSSLQRVNNPQGRIDWLAAKLVNRAVENSENPVLRAFYAELQPHLENLITKQLGPKNRTMRKIRYAVKMADRIRGRLKPR